MSEKIYGMSPGRAEDAALQLEHDFAGIVQEEIGMHDNMAALFAQALVRGLRRKLGGRDIYIPSPDNSARDAAIRRAFNGLNIEVLMREHGLTRRRIYQIVEQGRPRGAAPEKSETSSLEIARPSK
jgi:Mor family transcriptional regulator